MGFFWGLIFGPGFFWGFVGSPRDFFRSLEIQSTPPPLPPGIGRREKGRLFSPSPFFAPARQSVLEKFEFTSHVVDYRLFLISLINYLFRLSSRD